MTNAEVDKIINDDKWVKISFMTHCSQGHLLIKNSLYEKKIRKIEKTLRGLVYFIDYDYHLNFEEYMNFDDELNVLYRKKRFYKSQIDWYMDRCKDEQAKEYLKLNGENNNAIEKRIKELQKEFEKKGGEV